MDELLTLVNNIPNSASDEEDMDYSQGMCQASGLGKIGPDTRASCECDSCLGIFLFVIINILFADHPRIPSLKIDVCFQVLLRAGAKSVSHTFKALDKYVYLW